MSAQNVEIKVLVSGIEADTMDDIVATHTYKVRTSWIGTERERE